MPYMIFAKDKPDHGDTRVRVRPEHLDYLRSRSAELLAGGALFDDDGNPYGSLLIIDTEDRAEAEAFSAADPFTQAGLFGDVAISRWRKGFFDGSELS